MFCKGIDIPAVAKAFVILKAYKVALEEGWKEIVFYSDAEVVIQNLKNCGSGLAHWFILGIIEDILSLCHVFNSVSLVWTSILS